MAAPSLEVRKPPVGPAPSFTGPPIDPHALQGQWFLDPATEQEEVRGRELHDNLRWMGGGSSQYLAVQGSVSNIVYDNPTDKNIVAFDITATITNDIPGDWFDQGTNSHGETGSPWEQLRQGKLFGVKLTCDFAIVAGLLPPSDPGGRLYPDIPYRNEEQIYIAAINHQQLAWYCWTPENPQELMPFGAYHVPAWDFGDIQQWQSASRVLRFSIIDANSMPAVLAPADPRYALIHDSESGNIEDILLNRSSSLKISTWIDDLADDADIPYPHQGDPPKPPLRSSNCSVFHDERPVGAEIGGLSLDIRDVSWLEDDGADPTTGPDTGPRHDPHAIHGQWFLEKGTGKLDARSNEFYDPSEEIDDDLYIGSDAITGIVTNLVTDPASGFITGFTVEATIYNGTPWPYWWPDGQNCHNECLWTQNQYSGPLIATKLTCEFAIDTFASGHPLPVGDQYIDLPPRIVAVNNEQLAWYCWTPRPENPEHVPTGNYWVPTWDFGDIPQGQSATRTLEFTVEAPGLDPNDVADPRVMGILTSFNEGWDMLVNRPESLKVSTWQEGIAIDVGTPSIVFMWPQSYSSDCSVFHNVEYVEEDVMGISLDIKKPPFGGEVYPAPSWTGPTQDPHAFRGQWFKDLATGSETPRANEYHDYEVQEEEPYSAMGDGRRVAASGFALGNSAIFGFVKNIVTNAAGDITAFQIEATITNVTDDFVDWWWMGENSHGEWSYVYLLYVGTMYETKLTAEFAVDPTVGFIGAAGVADPVYRETDPLIEAIDHEQLAWYCWTPDNPDEQLQPFGTYCVPTWDFGDIAPGQAVTRTLSFQIPGGLPDTDLRWGAITCSGILQSDVLMNRTSSLKISNWIDDIAADTRKGYYHYTDWETGEERGLPLKSSDCSVFHNPEPAAIPGGLSLEVTKPPVVSGQEHEFTGPPGADPMAEQGQWFFGIGGTGGTNRTHEFYDNVVLPPFEMDAGVGYGAIYGEVRNVAFGITPPGGSQPNVVAFDLEVFITNLTPFPDTWRDGDNSHLESLSTDQQYAGTLYDTKLAIEFAADRTMGVPGNVVPPYRVPENEAPLIYAVNHDQLAWYCWTPENPYELRPFGSYYVPTWDFGDIPQGQWAHRTLHFQVDGDGIPHGDPRYWTLASECNGDILCNRSTSLKISTWMDEPHSDWGNAYPHEGYSGKPLRSSDCSVFHNTVPSVPLLVRLQLDWDWVYQNTQTTTQDRHASLVTVTLVSEAQPGETYSVTITDSGPGGANFTLGTVTDNRPGQHTLTAQVLGGRVGSSTPGAAGAPYTLTVTVTGDASHASTSANIPLTLRYIGDVDGSGAPGAQDKQFFNQRLNNVPTPYPDRCYDLTGNGGAPNAEDKQVMNQVLNGVPLP